MKRALVVYGSTSGNTMYLSQFVQAGLQDGGYEAVLKDVREIQLSDLDGYDLLVMGSSTWKMEGEQGRLQMDWEKLRPQLESFDFRQKKVAVFGVGHYSYTFTAKAGDILADIVRNHNGVLVGEIFRVDDVADLFAERIQEWARNLQ